MGYRGSAFRGRPEVRRDNLRRGGDEYREGLLLFRRDVVGVLDVPGHVTVRRSQALPQRVSRENVEAVRKSVIHGSLEGAVRTKSDCSPSSEALLSYNLS